MNEAMGRVAMHGVRRSVLEAQARAAGLPLHVVHIPHPCTNEVYEAQMSAAWRTMRPLGRPEGRPLRHTMTNEIVGADVQDPIVGADLQVGPPRE